jgi:hypothetical protein
MSKTKTVTLHEPIGAIKKIVLREPKLSDLVDLGMPATWVSLAGGGGFLQEMPVLYQWIECLAADIDPDYLGALCLRDALAVRGAVLAFFFDASVPAANQFSPSDDQLRIN